MLCFRSCIWFRIIRFKHDDNQDTTRSDIPPRIAEEPDEDSVENAAVKDEEERKECKSNRNLQVNDNDNDEISDENDEKKNAKTSENSVPKKQKKLHQSKHILFWWKN